MEVLSSKLLGGVDWPDGFRVASQELQNDSQTPDDLSPINQALFSEQNPFWEEGSAQAFWIPGQVRLIAFYHPKMRVDGAQAICFGYWRTRNSHEATSEIFKAVSNWSKSFGVSKICGPMNFKTVYDYRLRLNDFEAPSFWGEPSNPSYYPQLLEKQGYVVYQNYITDFIDDLDAVRVIADRRLPRLYSGDNEWKFEPLSNDVLAHSAGELVDLANRLFSANVAFQEVGAFDFALVYNRELLTQLCRKTSFLLRDSQNQLRGLCLSFPHPKDPDCVLIKTIGVDVETRHSGKTFAQFLHFIFKQSTSYKKMAFCLMTEGNAGHRLAAKYCNRRRTYGLFQKSEL